MRMLFGLTVSWSLFVGSAFGVSIEEVIENISANDALISVAEADFKVTMKNGLPYWQGSWGREHSKGYLRGTAWVRWENGSRSSYKEIYAFDGERLRTFQPDPNRLRGTVRKLGLELNSPFTPQTLLGQSILAYERQTLSDVLKDSYKKDELELTSADEVIDGRRCCLLTAIVPAAAIGHPEWTRPTTCKVWVDPERNYRPLRVEQYNDVVGKRLAITLEAIVLQKVNDIWLPVSGLKKGYRDVPVPLDGYTLEDLRSMSPDEAREHLRVETRPIEEPWGTKHMEVTEWRILDDIDEAKFTISFPPGSRIWDQFAQHGFVGKEAPDLSAAAWVNVKPVRLACLRGNPLVLAFWDSAHESSADVIETLNTLATRHSDVAVTAVHNAGPDMDALNKFISDKSIKFRVAVDEPSQGYKGATFEKYRVKEVPAIFIIDGEGRVSYQDIPLAAVEEAVKRLLDEE